MDAGLICQSDLHENVFEVCTSISTYCKCKHNYLENFQNSSQPAIFRRILERMQLANRKKEDELTIGNEDQASAE